MADYPLGPLSNSHIYRLYLIGTICQQWAWLEYTFSQAIWHFLKLDTETGKIVTGGMDIGPRYNMAINLAKHLKQPAEIIEALVAAREAIQGGLDTRRNRAVHGVPFLLSDWSMKTEVHRGKGGRERQPLNESELDSLANEIFQTMDALRKVLQPFVPLIAEDAKSEAMIDSLMASLIERWSSESPK